MRLIQSTFVFLAKRCQIFGYLSRLLGAQAHRRHLAAWFDDSRIVNPGNEVSQRVLRCACGNRLPAHEMCKVRTEGTGCRRTRNCVAVDTGRTLEDPFPLRYRGADVRWPALLLSPAFEIFPR